MNALQCVRVHKSGFAGPWKRRRISQTVSWSRVKLALHLEPTQRVQNLSTIRNRKEVEGGIYVERSGIYRVQDDLYIKNRGEHKFLASLSSYVYNVLSSSTCDLGELSAPSSFIGRLCFAAVTNLPFTSPISEKHMYLKTRDRTTLVCRVSSI
jgi:hypothetical protein